MKKLLIAAVVVAAGLVVFNYATTGEFKLIPQFAKSEQEQSVQDLADRLDAAGQSIAQAHRSAGLSGIDTTSDVEAARREAKRIKGELKKLQKDLTEDKAIRQAKDLTTKVDSFVRDL